MNMLLLICCVGHHLYNCCASHDATCQYHTFVMSKHATRNATCGFVGMALYCYESVQGKPENTLAMAMTFV